MEQHSKPTGQQIATRAQELKLVFLGLTMALPFLLHPAVPLLQWHRTELGVEPGDDIPIDLRHGSEEKALSYSASEALTKLTTLRGEVVGHDLMSISMMHGATRLGDLIDMGGHRQGNEPILEFARHFRNACAHGDRWHFRNKEPKHPAACRDLVLSATLDGQRATWNTISPRRYVEFLDDISNYFVPGAIPPPS
jgi:hypothetical protein